jgi:hypothetical protein
LNVNLRFSGELIFEQEETEGNGGSRGDAEAREVAPGKGCFIRIGRTPIESIMARRGKKGPDIIGISTGVGALVGLGFLSGRWRKVFADFSFVTHWLMVFAFAFLAFAVMWWALDWLKKQIWNEPGEQADGNEGKSDGEKDCSAAAVRNEPPATISEQLRRLDWFQFEKLVALAYSGTGVVTRRGGANPDGGIDLVLEKHGERIGIQCKHWKSWNVGVKVVREMIGAMADAGLKRGIVVSLSEFTAEAKELAARHSIELVEERGLVELLRYLDQAEMQGILSDARKFCPRCENEMVLRTARKGVGAGKQFWGCSEYPKCHLTLPFEAGA